MSVELFNENFIYDSETGIVYRKLKTNQNTPKQVGSLDDNGYLFAVLNRKYYQLHRVAYAMFHGVMPDYLIEHINGIKTDNRISNLRLKDRSKYKFYCDHCGNRVIKLLDGHEKKRLEKGLKIPVFCNIECRDSYKKNAIDANKSINDLLKKIKQEVLSLQKIKNYKESKSHYRNKCLVCGSYTKYTFGRSRKYCSKKCYKSTDSYRLQLKVSRLKRKALERGASVGYKINPIDIFNRDNWTCKICNCHTPEHKRGSYDDDAPELDHIYPLSKGGAHTFDNVQLLCRACNATKSDKIYLPVINRGRKVLIHAVGW